MPDRRLAVSGAGVVTPSGVGLDEFWQATLAGKLCVAAIEGFDATGFPTHIGGQIRDFSARKFVPKDYRKAVKVMARDIEIAVACADLAVRDAGLITPGMEGQTPNVEPKRLGCNIGAGLMCAELPELGTALITSLVDGKFDYKTWGITGMNNLTPLWLLKYLPNMLSCHTTIIHKAEGPSNNITCGDASGHMSVGEAAQWILRGAADVVIAGSAESKLNPMGLLRQTLMHRTCTTRNDAPTTACRPFDAGHAGFAIGEGGGLLILEDMDRAAGRGARIHAELVGFAAACDPHGIDLERPTCGNLAGALKNALRSAGIGPEDVGLAIAHGTAVPGEDEVEAAAWTEVFGRVGKLPAATLTGAVGCLFAGASGMDMILACKALHEQVIPPTVNFERPACESVLDFAAAPRQGKFEYAVTSAFTIGGQSAVCVFKRYQS
ncbi:MAG: beta-ketoacyl-[acyl-carrier-protein] synthase family protein [Planctomycetaceae bacterium]|nr:beta-ketoacyl-[acyl-carrier-protein] synthase family protein [Planctomycetaceae bacterium]